MVWTNGGSGTSALFHAIVMARCGHDPEVVGKVGGFAEEKTLEVVSESSGSDSSGDEAKVSSYHMLPDTEALLKCIDFYWPRSQGTPRTAASSRIASRVYTPSNGGGRRRCLCPPRASMTASRGSYSHLRAQRHNGMKNGFSNSLRSSIGRSYAYCSRVMWRWRNIWERPEVLWNGSARGRPVRISLNSFAPEAFSCFALSPLMVENLPRFAWAPWHSREPAVQEQDVGTKALSTLRPSSSDGR